MSLLDFDSCQERIGSGAPRLSSTSITNGSGVCYVRSDYQDDGVHPAQGARDKVSKMLHDRLLEDDWYRR